MALQAMAIVSPAAADDLSDDDATKDRIGEPKPHLWMHGANLDLQEGSFQNRFRELVEARATP